MRLPDARVAKYPASLKVRDIEENREQHQLRCLSRSSTCVYPGVNHVVFLVAIQPAPCRLPRRGNRVIRFVAGSCVGRGECP